MTTKLGYRNEDVIVLGESLGSAVAGYIAEHRKVGGIIILSGMTSLLAAGRERLGFLNIYPDWCFPDPHYDNLSVLEKANVPVLIIHGDKDSMMPVRFASELFDKARQPKKLLILRGAGHGDTGDARFQPAIIKALTDFIAL